MMERESYKWRGQIREYHLTHHETLLINQGLSWKYYTRKNKMDIKRGWEGKREGGEIHSKYEKEYGLNGEK